MFCSRSISVWMLPDTCVRWNLRCKGSVELVRSDDLLPDLKRGSGLSSWKVIDDDLEEHKTYEELESKPHASRKKHLFCRSMWPPGKGEGFPLGEHVFGL